jgi:hypothetical protein
VSDIFQEVDEEVRRERLKKLWEQWGTYILIVACLVVVGIGGWRAWQWYEAKRAAEAGDAFEAALALSEAGKHQEAEAAFANIAAKSPAGYRMLARFRAAEELATRDRPAAAHALDALAADSSLGRVMQDFAAVRAALLLADTASYDEMRRRLEPVTGAQNPFRHTARELIALSAWRAGDIAAARRWFDMIVTDPETPASTRSRVDMLMALAAGDGKG